MDRNNTLTYSNVHQNYQLTHPEMCLVVDKVGANQNQKDDGHIGGQKFMCEVGYVPQLKVSTKDRHFTLLGFAYLKCDHLKKEKEKFETR